MFGPLDLIESITAHKTDHHDMGNYEKMPPAHKMSIPEALVHLEHPHNALVITDLEEASGECKALTPVAVWCGAGEARDNYYYQSLPLEDPGDANGGDLDAGEAIAQALDQLCLQ